MSRRTAGNTINVTCVYDGESSFLHRAFMNGELLTAVSRKQTLSSAPILVADTSGYTPQSGQVLLIEVDFMAASANLSATIAVNNSTVRNTGSLPANVWSHQSVIYTFSANANLLAISFARVNSSGTIYLRNVRMTLMDTSSFNAVSGDYTSEYVDNSNSSPSTYATWPSNAVWRRVTGWKGARPRIRKMYLTGGIYFSGDAGEDIEDYLIWTASSGVVCAKCIQSYKDAAANCDPISKGLTDATVKQYWRQVQYVPVVATDLLLAERALIENLMVDTLYCVGNGKFVIAEPGQFVLGVTSGSTLPDIESNEGVAVRLETDGDGNGVLAFYKEGNKIGVIDESFFGSTAVGNSWSSKNLAKVSSSKLGSSAWPGISSSSVGQTKTWYKFSSGYTNYGGTKLYNDSAHNGMYFESRSVLANEIPDGTYVNRDPETNAIQQSGQSANSYHTVYYFKDGKVKSIGTANDSNGSVNWYTNY